MCIWIGACSASQTDDLLGSWRELVLVVHHTQILCRKYIHINIYMCCICIYIHT